MEKRDLIAAFNRRLCKYYNTFGNGSVMVNDILAILYNSGIDLKCRFTESEINIISDTPYSKYEHSVKEKIRETKVELRQQKTIRMTANNLSDKNMSLIESAFNSLPSVAKTWTDSKEFLKTNKRRTSYSTIAAFVTVVQGAANTIYANNAAGVANNLASNGASIPAATGKKPKRHRGSKRNPDKFKELFIDIETNQFYDYSAFCKKCWTSKRFVENKIEKAVEMYEDVYGDVLDFNIIRPIIADIMQEMYEKTEIYKNAYKDRLKDVKYKAGLDIFYGLYQTILDLIDNYTADCDDVLLKEIIRGSCLAMYDPSVYTTKKESHQNEPEVYAENGERMAPHSDQIKPSHAEIYMIGVIEHENIINGMNWWEMKPDDYKNAIKSEDKDKAVSKYYRSFRTAAAFNEWLEIEENKAKNAGQTILIHAHNLSYEGNLLFKNCQMFKNAVADNRLSYLANSTKDSIKCMDLYTISGESKTKTMEIRDSWKITGASIDKLGKKYEMEKNGDGSSYDYLKIRKYNPESPLFAKIAKEDYSYNSRDCEICAVAVQDIYNKYPEIAKKNKTFYSGTNIVKQTTELDCKKNKIIEYGKEKRVMTEEQYAEWKTTAHGGFVAVNPYLAGQLFAKGYDFKYLGTRYTYESFFHIDLNSAHPSQAFTKLFPVESGAELDASSFPSLKQTLESSMLYAKWLTNNRGENASDYVSDMSYGVETIVLDTERVEELINGKKVNLVRNFSGYGSFILTDVKLKAGSIPFMSSAIQTDPKSNLTYEEAEDGIELIKGENITAKSGKVMAADKIYINCTAEDLICFSLFYDFDFEIRKYVRYKMGLCNKQIVRAFRIHGGRKVFYKELYNAVKDKDMSEDYIEGDKAAGIPAKKGIKGIYNRSKAVAAANKHEQYIEKQDYEYIEKLMENGDNDTAEAYAKEALSFVKGQFNGIYGTNYQSMFRRAFDFFLDENGNISEKLAEGSNEKYGAKFEQAYNEDGKQVGQKIDFMQGAYIAQNSRIDIALYTALAINLGCIPLYVATDSIYGIITQASEKNSTDILCSKCYNQQSTGSKARRIWYIDGQRPIFFNNLGVENFLYKDKDGNQSYYNEWKLGGMDLEKEDIIAFAYTMCLKCIYLCNTKAELKDYATDVYHKLDETKIEVTFSGCSAGAFFKNYSQTKTETDYVDKKGKKQKIHAATLDEFRKYFTRLTMLNGYCSPFDTDPKSNKFSKSSKAQNNENASSEEGYVLAPVAFINNNTTICRREGKENLAAYQVLTINGRGEYEIEIDPYWSHDWSTYDWQ